MPLDPQVRGLLDQLEQMGRKPYSDLTPEDARSQFERVRTLGGTPEPVAKAEDRTIPGPAGDLKTRTYTPSGEPPFPVMVFFHGGGWVIGDLETYDNVCRSLCNSSGSLIVAIDYRLAPEHKFPAAVDDAYAATQWVVDHAVDLGGDPGRLGVGGDSAGGNLSAVVALLARDRGGPALAYQLLLYPVTDGAMNTPSIHENAEGYLLSRMDMVWFYDHYLDEAGDKLNPLVSPLLADDHSRLPPAIIVTAQFDPLRDEGEAYGEKLRRAGVAVKVRRYDGMIHGFLSMSGVVHRGREALQDVGAELRELVGGRSTPVG
jgi:acetyl esterase